MEFEIQHVLANRVIFKEKSINPRATMISIRLYPTQTFQKRLFCFYSLATRGQQVIHQMI